MMHIKSDYFIFLLKICPHPKASACGRAGEGDLGDVRRWRWDGKSCPHAVVRTCPFFPTGLRPLRPDPAQQTAAPPGADQPADQQGDEDACRGRKPLQVSPQSIPLALGYILPHAGESFWLFYPCLSHCRDPWHVQEAPAGCLLRGMFLDYQLLVFPPVRQVQGFLDEVFFFKPVCKRGSVPERLLFALGRLSVAVPCLGFAQSSPGFAALALETPALCSVPC